MHSLAAPETRGGALTSVIFPAYNPGSAIDDSLEATREFLGTSREAWEVLYVCDGCTDGTPERLRDLLTPGDRQVRVLSYQANRGKGYAVRQGLLAALGRWRIFADVDLAYGFADIERVAQSLRSGAEVAIASREHPRSEVLIAPRLVGYLYRRHLQSRLFGSLARGLLPIRQHDTQAGLKGMSEAVAERVVPRMRCDGFGFDCELLTACSRFGIAVEEVPVRVRYRDAVSTTGWRATRQMFGDLFRIRRDWNKEIPAPRPIMEPLMEQPRSALEEMPAAA